MRIVVTGQVGVDKKPFLARVAELAEHQGYDLTMCNVGEMMYAEAPDVSPGRILDLPLSRLNSLRRSVFKDILSVCDAKPNVLINTHVTFRWRHGLFYGFDYDQMQALEPDLYIVLVDNIDRVHRRLVEDGHTDHSLKDLMVWREEEILATELLTQIVRGHGRFYIFARGFDDSTADALVRLMCQPNQKKAYISFPMTHVTDMPGTLAEIERTRRQLKRYFVCFDPADLEEKYLTSVALNAARDGHRTVEIGPPDERVTVDVGQLVDIIPDIDGQIYSRDFKLIDQSDMIVSLIPELEDGRPGLSSGVERELQHAYESTRDVFVIWKPQAEPSPFITETATKVFASAEEAIDAFHECGFVTAEPHGRLFNH
ncbi:MAG: AAA family ATPase [Planctomycetota bacterium]|jgi:adenylate kinase